MNTIRYCDCCGGEIITHCPAKTSDLGKCWHLSGFLKRFWGLWCRECFYMISQTPNHEIINQEEFNKAAVMYELRKANKGL